MTKTNDHNGFADVIVTVTVGQKIQLRATNHLKSAMLVKAERKSKDRDEFFGDASALPVECLICTV